VTVGYWRRAWLWWIGQRGDKCRRCAQPYSHWFRWDGVRYCWLCFDRAGGFENERPAKRMLCAADIISLLGSGRAMLRWYERFPNEIRAETP
jgi:hypothetical protein